MSPKNSKQGTTKKIRRSVQLSKEQRIALNKYLKQFGTTEEEAEALGIDRGTLRRIKELGRANSKNISIVLKKISHAA